MENDKWKMINGNVEMEMSKWKLENENQNPKN
jgi:hypothetical protein